MAVFHPNHDELHGFTVCIRAKGGKTYIGRWDHQHEGKILIKGASAHIAGDGGMDQDGFIKQAALWGFSPEAESLIVEAGEVESIRKLGEVATELRGW